MTSHRSRRSLLLAACLGLALTTAGCSEVTDTLQKTHQESFSDWTAAQEGWVGVPVPAWIPRDATRIHNLSTNDDTQSVILVRSPSALPSTCEEVQRSGLPFDTRDWTPKVKSFPDRVDRCGVYEVMPVEGGWFGWFNAAKKGQTPDSD